MELLKNIQIYKPEDPYLGKNVLYYKDEEGRDWYKAQKDFSDSTYKITYDPRGNIRCCSQDVSMLLLFPHDSVAEIEEKNFPKNFVLGEYCYDQKTGKIKKRIKTENELIAIAKQKIKDSYNKAIEEITPLQYAVDLDMATKEDLELLRKWKKYLVQLTKVSKQETFPQQIEWPSLPKT